LFLFLISLIEGPSRQ